jgi:hypothetical protein
VMNIITLSSILSTSCTSVPFTELIPHSFQSVNRTVLETAHDCNSGVRAKTLTKLTQPPLEGGTLASPQPMAIALIAAHLLPFDIECSNYDGLRRHVLLP